MDDSLSSLAAFEACELTIPLLCRKRICREKKEKRPRVGSRNVVALGSRPVVFSVLLKFSSVQVPPSLGRPGATTNGRVLALKHISSLKENWVLEEKVLGNLRQKKMVCLSLPRAIAQYMKRIGQS